MQDHYDFYLDQSKIPQNLDIIINNIGFSHNLPNYSAGYDRREYYILHYIIDGCGTYTINNSTYHLSAGDGFIVIPNTTVIYRADIKNPWTVYWVGFYGNKTEYYLSRINVKISNPIFHFSDIGLLVQCMEKLYSEIQSRNISFELILGYFYQTIGTIQKNTSKELNLYQPMYYYQSVLTFIEHNLRRPIKVQDLADSLMLSPSHIYRIIKKESGLTPHELIEKMKIEKACELLSTTNISIQEIALLLGYEYVSHFFMVFKKKMKITPGEYRNSRKI